MSRSPVFDPKHNIFLELKHPAAPGKAPLVYRSVYLAWFDLLLHTGRKVDSENEIQKCSNKKIWKNRGCAFLKIDCGFSESRPSSQEFRSGDFPIICHPRYYATCRCSSDFFLWRLFRICKFHSEESDSLKAEALEQLTKSMGDERLLLNSVKERERVFEQIFGVPQNLQNDIRLLTADLHGLEAAQSLSISVDQLLSTSQSQGEQSPLVLPSLPLIIGECGFNYFLLFVIFVTFGLTGYILLEYFKKAKEKEN